MCIRDRVDVERWQGVAAAVLSGEGAHGECYVGFVGEEEITELNQQHMGKPGPTDVLSFPIEAQTQPGVPRMIGDIVVCPTVARRQAKDHDWSTDSEIALLVVHGALHLLGHDHAEADERNAMQALEAKYLAQFGYEHKVFNDA